MVPFRPNRSAIIMWICRCRSFLRTLS
uniref:Uncharacterized protein n=1 Tax=Anguilla anguilla TaxID=7936 RepID=A0A0E9VC43_ANGAN